MSVFPLKPSHKPVKAYFDALATFEKHGHTTEGNTRSAFADLLKRCASAYHWHLVEEYQFRGTAKQPLRADGALVDDLTLVHGLWEAKDTADDLQREIKAKVTKGYPLTNILFQSPSRAVLYQDNRIAFDADISAPEKLIEVLQLFCEHKQAHEVDWETAVIKFAEKIPELAGGVTKILVDEDLKNPVFRQNFQSFAELCRQSINPDLNDDSIRKMLVQHLLTARIFIKVFKNEEFLRRNIIAAEIEKVIDSITSRYFSRNEFLKPLDRFYTAIEKAAESQEGYTEKQHFLNAVYEKFFQRFDTKQADTHGIVYTPQPIVDFMVRSVDEILQQEFGKTLSDSGVHILDPFTGTGNFITRVMQQIKRSALPQKYAEELHCNEIMLLPYYIASMNIEQAYMEKIGNYRPFEGLCLVDTFQLSELGQQSFAFTYTNTERVLRQKKQPIFVIIGNPPYNMGQVNEHDQNKNRKYKHWDDRIKETYTRASTAVLRNKLSDPYVKAFRWASDRIRNGGIVAYITNNSYIDQIAFDGMRHHLSRDFSKLYILDLGGNVRQNPKLSGTTHNVFGIQVGVSISLLVKLPGHKGKGQVLYTRMAEDWKRGQKYAQLDAWERVSTVKWKQIVPDERGTWLTDGQRLDYSPMLPLSGRGANSQPEDSVFEAMSLGVVSARDSYAFNHSRSELGRLAKNQIATYRKTVAAYQEAIKSGKAMRPFSPWLEFINMADTTIKWSRQVIGSLSKLQKSTFNESHIRSSLYRPFCKEWHYFADFWNEERYQMPRFFPKDECGNYAICLSGVGSSKAYSALVTDRIFSFDLIEKT